MQIAIIYGIIKNTVYDGKVYTTDSLRIEKGGSTMTRIIAGLQGLFEKYIVYPWETFQLVDVLDWLLVALLFYGLHMLARGRAAARIGMGLLALGFLSFLADQMGMTGFHTIMSHIAPFGVILLAVIYQPELRDMLTRIGSLVSFWEGHVSTADNTIHAVVEAACQIAQSEKDGALIVLELSDRVDESVDKGHEMNLEVSSNTICGLFKDKTLFHDGAVVIRNDRIVMAGCKLPLCRNGDAVEGLGTRHRAAAGITESTDCVVVVVSEESHKISIANNGHIIRNYNRGVKELQETKARQSVERHLRSDLYGMLKGTTEQDESGRKGFRGVRVRFKWGCRMDREDREARRRLRERRKEILANRKKQEPQDPPPAEQVDTTLPAEGDPGMLSKTLERIAPVETRIPEGQAPVAQPAENLRETCLDKNSGEAQLTESPGETQAPTDDPEDKA